MKKRISNISKAIIWLLCLAFLITSFFFRPNVYSFLVWNAAVNYDIPKIEEYAQKLEQSNYNRYHYEGIFYTLFAQIIKTSLQEKKDTNTEITKRINIIKQKITNHLKKINTQKSHNKTYKYKLLSLLAWIYFYQNEYDKAAQTYLQILIYNPNDEVARYNYEVSLLLKKSAYTVPDNDKNIKQEISKNKSNILSLFKIQESNAYTLFEQENTNKNLPNY